MGGNDKMTGTKELGINDIIFREDLYPRLEKNPTTVQAYAEILDVLPPIEVNQHNELIDGWHRWTAHKKKERETIHVTVTQTKSDTELLELTIERNNKWGLQLTNEDKKNVARRIYHITPERERDIKKQQLAKLLSVPERTLRGWLSRIDKDAKEARDKRIFDLWLACYTQEEIAKSVGVDTTDKILRVSGNLADLPNNQKPQAEHLTDFEPPIYNVWKQQKKTAGANHFGNSEVRWLDNLLYLYTKPFDIVIDPFAGGGSTIDLCKKRLRRYWVGDRKPIVERETEIRKHDIVTDGPPDLKGRWKDVQLVYLDPPYWKQSEGKYSNDPTDLANMSLEEFTATLEKIINGFGKKLKEGYIALIIQPTQWNAMEKQYTDHIADMLRVINLPLDMRYSVPYESQQCNAQMVEWAKAEKKTLVLTREIVVWKMK